MSTPELCRFLASLPPMRKKVALRNLTDKELDDCIDEVKRDNPALWLSHASVEHQKE